MVITSSILYYQLAKKIDFVEKKSPSNKLQIKNVRFYHGKTEVGCLYLVDCKRLDKPIEAKKPVSFIIINAENLNKSFIPSNCDYAIFKNVKNFFDLAEIVYDCIYELQNWDCKLKDAVSSRFSLLNFGEIAKDIINEPIFILTHDLSIITLSGNRTKALLNDKVTDVTINTMLDNPGVKHPLSIDYANGLLEDSSFTSTMTSHESYQYSDPDGRMFTSINLFSGDKYVARMMSPTTFYGTTADEGQIQLLHHFYTYLKHIYLRNVEDPLIKNSADKLHYLVNNILFEENNIDENEANLILENYNWNKNHHYTIFYFNFFKNENWDEMTEYICGKLEETWTNSCAITHDDDIIWIFNHSLSSKSFDDKKFFRVLEIIVSNFVCKVGISDSFKDIKLLPSYLRQAIVALELGQKDKPENWYFKFSDYVLDYMYEKIMSDFSYDQIIYEGIRKLMAYDEKNNTEYLTTLKCYLKNNCNSTHTAEELFVHRTTLIRRIDRIQEICNIDFSNEDVKTHMDISFWILEKLNIKFNNPNINQ